MNYRVTIRGEVPNDLTERICRAHAEAVAALWGKNASEAKRQPALVEGNGKPAQSCAPGGMVTTVGATDCQQPTELDGA